MKVEVIKTPARQIKRRNMVVTSGSHGFGEQAHIMIWRIPDGKKDSFIKVRVYSKYNRMRA
jgi:hypothetical protein